MATQVSTRLVIENPDKRYAEALGLGSGVLYKSSSTNRFRYLGDAPLTYASDFDQINAKGTHDLTPIIQFTEVACQMPMLKLLKMS